MIVNSNNWNKQVNHPLQAWEWGEFRIKTGVKVAREGGIQVTIHPIPYTRYNIGYAPKVTKSPRELAEILAKVSREQNCIFIKTEPMIEKVELGLTNKELHKLGFTEGRALFTKYNLVLDVTPSESVLLSSFKSKTRYNIRLAQKKGVTVELSESESDFERYLELTAETTKRQGFYAHSSKYHRLMWEELGAQNSKRKVQNHNSSLTAYLLTAKFEGEVITTWVLFKFKDTLYYPYGASTREHREVMANNLMMWEAIRLAKGWGLKYLDMWGALGPEPDKNDPWYGFHNFKMGYAPREVEYIGSWDYVDKPGLYRLFRTIEKMRWAGLRLVSRFK